jgi:hypothetical protein
MIIAGSSDLSTMAVLSIEYIRGEFKRRVTKEPSSWLEILVAISLPEPSHTFQKTTLIAVILFGAVKSLIGPK